MILTDHGYNNGMNENENEKKTNFYEILFLIVLI